jgi:hypothetical protein
VQIRKLPSVLLLFGLLVASRDLTATGGPEPLLVGVRVSPTTFLPSLGQSVELTAGVAAPGTLTLEVLDRDGFVIRTLAAKKPIKAGRLSLTWDGKDDTGQVVPDEAYSFRLALSTTKGRALYFPANTESAMYEVPPAYYSSTDAALVYELPRPSRVLIQAGEAIRDAATKGMSGPVLKTIVNREPRPEGRIVDHWNGQDETGTLLVSGLPNFVVSIACWPLPENSVIATGNRLSGFVEYALSRKGRSRFRARSAHNGHHAGLTTLEDVSPKVTVGIGGGTRAGASGCWQIAGATLSLSLDVTGPTAAAFRRQPGRILVYEGVSRIAQRVSSPRTNEVSIRLREPFTEKRILAVNWTSNYGPTAPGLVCVEPRRTNDAGEERSQR